MTENLSRHPLFDEAGNVRQAVHQNMVNLESLGIPEVRQSIPSLQTALEAWRFEDDHSLLIARTQMMPRAHAPLDFVTGVYEDLTINGLPILIVEHQPSFSAKDTVEALSERESEIKCALGTETAPAVLKTISVEFRHPEGRRIILVSGTGDFQLERSTKKEIAAELGVSARKAKSAKINPSDFDTTLWLGLIPGMVMPTVQPHLIGILDGLAHLRLTEPSEYVAFLTSPIDSIIMPTDRFEDHLKEYANAEYLGFELVETEEFDLWADRN